MQPTERKEISLNEPLPLKKWAVAAKRAEFGQRVLPTETTIKVTAQNTSKDSHAVLQLFCQSGVYLKPTYDKAVTFEYNLIKNK